MARKNINWKTKGMNRDISVSAFNPEFSFENVNLRLATNDGNTMMSWVNERGPKKLNLSISGNGFDIQSQDALIGTPIGTSIINHQLVLFTTDSSNDYIYCLWKSKSRSNLFEGKVLYKGHLGFKTEHPLETLASYESKDIQKVYWVDGINQPRMINVAYTHGSQLLTDTSFDFVPELELKEKVNVTKIFGSGEFPAGVIQYAFTYYNKHGQESNIFYTTPLQYISYVDRGGSPGSKIANSFKLDISGIDRTHHFDFLRIYSILRTSKDAVPLVKRVTDLPLQESTTTYSSNAKAIALQSSNFDDFGKTMKVSNFAKFNQIDISNGAFYVQGAASYGKYLFQAYIAGKYIDVIDLETNQRVATMETNISYDFNAYHGNVLSFGKTIADGSSFPYLYYSCESNASPCILVIKIVNSGNTWTSNVVSRIYLPKCNGGDSQSSGTGGYSDFTHYYQNGCVDSENGYIWVSGYTMSSFDQDTGSYDGNKLIYRKYNLPSSYSSNVYLSANDVIMYFTLSFKKGTQGMVIRDSKLYQCFGYDKSDIYDEYLDCIDLEKGEIIKSYNFPKEQLKDLGEELESPYIYNDNLYLSATCNNWRYYTLWSITFTSDSGSSGGDSGGVVVPPTEPTNPVEPDITSSYDISYIDDGLHGETIDPTELLYKGGEEIIASTLEQKDGTLFLGNIDIKRRRPNIQSQLLSLSGASKSNPLSSKIMSNMNSRNFILASKEPLSYINTLSSSNGTQYLGASGFKGGEYYRLGVQFQYKNGKWAEPYWIGDAHETSYPQIKSDNGSSIWIPGFTFSMIGSIFATLYDAGYRKVRPVFAVPNLSDRTIICQGVGCPTMYRKADRFADEKYETEGKLYSQSSWLFRTGNSGYGSLVRNMDAPNGGGYISNSGKLKSQFDTPVYPTPPIPVENSNNIIMSPYLRSTEIMGYYDDAHSFYIDDNFATIHSPELEFDTLFSSLDFTGCTMNLAGKVTLEKTYGDIDIQTSTPPIGSDAAGFVHRSIVTDGTAALITAPFYNDYLVDDPDYEKFEAYHTESPAIDYPVYMWQKDGSLNNDVTRDNGSAKLLKKRISNYRLGFTSYNSSTSYSVEDIQLFNSDELSIVKVDVHVYMGNIDTMLNPTKPSPHFIIGNPWRASNDDTQNTDFNSDSYYVLKLADPSDTSSKCGVWAWRRVKWMNTELGAYDFQTPNGSEKDIGDKTKGLCQWRESIRMKYKSSPHLAVKLSSGSIFKDVSKALPLVEVVKPYNKETLFGGTSDEALQAATWIPCGLPVSFDRSDTLKQIYFYWGDTYYQRYECLKTYPFTPEDKNQVVEIASFMVETRVNIDGRYDRNRAQTSNLNMTPQNFNLMNPVYSQMDNFFSYKILDDDAYKDTSYPNNITWTKTKENGADIDLWTNVTLANTLELDGNKGEITELTRLNNQLLCFQDSGFSQILYNENTQISTTEGVPIEIANSEKVQGKRYYSDTVGCSNKWSMVQTPAGIYFMDSNDKSIYMFNGQLNNISTMGGFNSWAKQNIPSASTRWTPNEFGNFVGYYDKMNQDVLYINDNTALAYSEKFNCFTSFYDYSRTPYFESLDDMGIWIREGYLWEHQAGEYCNFFGLNKPFSMTLVANQEPQVDKIFTNLEFRSCVEGEGSDTEGRFAPLLPFDTLEVWNEYQHGMLSLSNRNKGDRFTHGTSNGILARKFRVWRCDIPRDNVTPSDSEAQMGIKRFKARPLDRIRNTWAYIKLKKNAVSIGSLNKTEIHDIMASYFD